MLEVTSRLLKQIMTCFSYTTNDYTISNYIIQPFYKVQITKIKVDYHPEIDFCPS